jgi:hypothetical protein
MAAALCYKIAVIISRENIFPFIPYWVVVAKTAMNITIKGESSTILTFI